MAELGLAVVLAVVLWLTRDREPDDERSEWALRSFNERQDRTAELNRRLDLIR